LRLTHLATNATGEPRHQPQLDGIRGIAILAVLLSHGAGLMGVMPQTPPLNPWVSLVSFLMIPGWGGVDLFFTLSGFLITGILLRARTQPTYFRSFYARRVLRIFPIYYLFLTATLLTAHLSPAFATLLPDTAKDRFSYFVYLQNWPFFWNDYDGMFSLWGIFWSLALEEQFYLVWPAIVRFLSVRTLFSICIAGFLLGTPMRWIIIQHVTGMDIGALQFPLSRLDGLFLGAAIALYRELYGATVPWRWAKISFGLGAAMLLFIGIFHIEEYRGLGINIATYGVTGFVLMSASLVVASQQCVARLTGVLTLRPLLIAGRYSYGMYVYDLLIYTGFSWLARRISPATKGELKLLPALAWIAMAIFTTTAIADLSYRLVEAPLLRLKRFFPSPAPLEPQESLPFQPSPNLAQPLLP
jgi:peptidoglycan/LPS O-acetylase OafA/YrhL